ncbi:DUF4189 domain-containing protein [Nocardia sp. NBC_00565]|uniref:DUF4189 domain-containing protein n=1 Tax=Nocardia sp. NBC_00565 TaxID=2975993 RepID=UPI002E81F964|nr:DUF4189 domain-containing protein [Nocardia sp. NBC_00565]WUC07050.1 DUF4189 domain-containing protein [Nocardia sp. NBC_00565]
MSLSSKAVGLAAASAGAFIAVGAGAAQADGGLYGSLAISVSAQGDATLGWAYNYANWADSDRVAVQHCGLPSCHIIVQFANACAAVARNGDDHLGWAWAPTRAEAEQQAIANAGPTAPPPLLNFGSSVPRAPRIVDSQCTANAS